MRRSDVVAEVGSEGRDHWNQTWGYWLFMVGLVLIVGANLGVTVGSSWLVPGYLHQENLGVPSAHTYLKVGCF